MNRDTRNNIITVFLGIIIILLGYVLYDSIVTPYEKVLEERAITDETRDQMVKIRDGLVTYNRVEGRFPHSLDSLLIFLQNHEEIEQTQENDTYYFVRDADTILYQQPPLENLFRSPRTNREFEYTLNDTMRPQIYLLEDPDTDDHIGDLQRTTRLNATSWN